MWKQHKPFYQHNLCKENTIKMHYRHLQNEPITTSFSRLQAMATTEIYILG
jgi:mannosyltransferase OCH1-like enzyme